MNTATATATATSTTPAPWRAAWCESNRRCKTGSWVIFGGPLDMPIIGQSSAIRTRKNEADARLMAAAPEMLAALKAGELAVRQAADSREIPEEDRATLHMIQAAIAKAEGRS